MLLALDQHPLRQTDGPPVVAAQDQVMGIGIEGHGHQLIRHRKRVDAHLRECQPVPVVRQDVEIQQKKIHRFFDLRRRFYQGLHLLQQLHEIKDMLRAAEGQRRDGVDQERAGGGDGIVALLQRGADVAGLLRLAPVIQQLGIGDRLLRGIVNGRKEPVRLAGQKTAAGQHKRILDEIRLLRRCIRLIQSIGLVHRYRYSAHKSSDSTGVPSSRKTPVNTALPL